MRAELKEQNLKVLLFTGHMIDAENRKEPRFPKEREAEIRQKIKVNVKDVLESNHAEDNYIAIAGGACGGDLLFLEICNELGLKVKMLLALPAEDYIAESVSFAGKSWVDRFYRMYEDSNTEVSVFAQRKDLEVSVIEQDEYSFWERNNLWLLKTALSFGGSNLTLIAVWDGKGEDGPGGTKHMIQEVQKSGAKSIVIPLK